MDTQKVIKEDIKEISNNLGKTVELFSGKTLLITGGLGFLGRYMVGTMEYLNEHILSKPCRLIVIDNHITSVGEHLFVLSNRKNILYIEHDVTKQFYIKEKIDFIIHAAGIASPIYYTKYPLQTIDVAVNGTRNMLELAKKKKVKSFLFFSSSEIYGDPPAEKIPTKETYNGNVSSMGPRACYDESKRLGETLCITYKTLFDTPVKIVRPFNVFGPGMKLDDYRVIPRFIYNALNDKLIPVHTHGRQTRSFCYIADAIVGFLLVLLKGEIGEAYNVGSDNEEIAMNKLAQILNHVFDDRLKIKNVSYPDDYPQGEPQRRCPDLTKVKTLGYSPSISLNKGLKKTVEWCRNNWL